MNPWGTIDAVAIHERQGGHAASHRLGDQRLGLIGALEKREG